MHPFRPPRNYRPSNPLRPPRGQPFGYSRPRALSPASRPGFQGQRFPPPITRNQDVYPSRVPSDGLADHSRSSAVSDRSLQTKQVIEYGHSSEASREVMYGDNSSVSYSIEGNRYGQIDTSAGVPSLRDSYGRGYSEDQRRVRNYGHEVDYSVVDEPYQRGGYRDGFAGRRKHITASEFDTPIGDTYNQTYRGSAWTGGKPPTDSVEQLPADSKEGMAHDFLKSWDQMTKPFLYKNKIDDQLKDSSNDPDEKGLQKPVTGNLTESASNFKFNSKSIEGPVLPTTTAVSSLPVSSPAYKSPSQGRPANPKYKPVSFAINSSQANKSPGLRRHEVPTTNPQSSAHTSGPMIKSPSLGHPEVPITTSTSAVPTSVARAKGSAFLAPSAPNNQLTSTKKVGDQVPGDHQGNKPTNNSSQNGEKTENENLMCVICNVKMANQAALQTHEKGMLHSARLKTVQNKSSQATEKNSSQMQDTTSSSSIGKYAKHQVTNQTSPDSASKSTNEDADSDEDDELSCTYCNMTFTDTNGYAKHIRGMLHTQNLMAAESGKPKDHSEEGPFKTIETVSALEETKDIVVRPHRHPNKACGNKGKDTGDGDEDSYDFDTSNWMEMDEKLHRKKPVDERDLDPDEIGKPKFPNEFQCMICDVNCTSADGYHMHMQGNKHKSKITSLKNAERLLGLKKTESEECPSELEPRPSIYELLKNSSVPLLGLNYVTEYQDPFNSKQNRYVCNLCESKCDCNTIISHLTGSKHRLHYFKENHTDVYEHLTKHSSIKKKSVLNQYMDDIAQEVFKKEGLKAMKVKKASELIPDQAEVLQLLTQKGIFKPEVAKLLTKMTEPKESLPSAEKRSMESPGPSNEKKRKIEEENEGLESVDNSGDHYPVRYHGDEYDDKESNRRIIDYGHKATREEPESNNPSEKEIVVDDEKERLFKEFLEWKKFKEYVATKTESSSQMEVADGEPSSSQQAPNIQETSVHPQDENQSSFVKGQGQDNYHQNHPYNQGHIDNARGQMSIQGHINVAKKGTFQDHFGNTQFPGNVQSQGTFGNIATYESHLNVHNHVNVHVPHQFSQNVTGIQGQQDRLNSTSVQQHQNYNTACGSTVQQQVKGQGQESSSQGDRSDSTKEEEANIAVSNIKETIGRLSSSLIKSEDEAALVLEVSNALTQSLLKYRLKNIPEEVQMKITTALDKAQSFQSEQKLQGTGKTLESAVKNPKQVSWETPSSSSSSVKGRVDPGHSLPGVQRHKQIEPVASGNSHSNLIGKYGKLQSSQQNISPLSVTSKNLPTQPVGTELKLTPMISKDQPAGSKQLRTNPVLQKGPSFPISYPNVSGYTGVVPGIPPFPDQFKDTHKIMSSTSNQPQWQQSGNFSSQMWTHSQQEVPSGYSTSRVSDIKTATHQTFRPPLPPPPVQPPLPPPPVQPPLPPPPVQPPLPPLPVHPPSPSQHDQPRSPFDHRKMKPPYLPSRYVP